MADIETLVDIALRKSPKVASHVGVGLLATMVLQAEETKNPSKKRIAELVRCIKRREAKERRTRANQATSTTSNISFEERAARFGNWLARRHRSKELKYTNQELVRLATEFLKTSVWRETAEDLVAELRTQWTAKGVPTASKKTAQRQ